jgi:hypothetical protein
MHARTTLSRQSEQRQTCQEWQFKQRSIPQFFLVWLEIRIDSKGRITSLMDEAKGKLVDSDLQSKCFENALTERNSSSI